MKALVVSGLNSLQQKTVKRIIDIAHNAHLIDVVIRKDGKEIRMDGDWIKQLAEIDL